MAHQGGPSGAHQILLIVGAHPLAERSDRASAYTLQEHITKALRSRPRPADAELPEVLICTDLWYLNDEGMRQTPAISVGSPGVNAYTAYLAARLPSAFAIDDVLIVQLDLTSTPPLAACWGTTPARTAQAITIFVERYLADFLGAAIRD
jgi:hypothetical protein